MIAARRSPAQASLYSHEARDRLPLSVLQRWQAKALLPSSSVPPLERGRMWSRVGAADFPHERERQPALSTFPNYLISTRSCSAGSTFRISSCVSITRVRIRSPSGVVAFSLRIFFPTRPVFSEARFHAPAAALYSVFFAAAFHACIHSLYLVRATSWQAACVFQLVVRCSAGILRERHARNRERYLHRLHEAPMTRAPHNSTILSRWLRQCVLNPKQWSEGCYAAIRAVVLLR
jgi:hypothetical protein